MKTVFAFLALLAVAYGAKVNTITGTTPPAIHCPDRLCHHKKDGNFEHPRSENYFVQCVNGGASCQPCWPLHLIFRVDCNQCLKTKRESCATTQPFEPATTLECPDLCPKRGPHFSGNIPDPYTRFQYVACWKGRTIGCVLCPRDLVFNERWNACVGKEKDRKLR